MSLILILGTSYVNFSEICCLTCFSLCVCKQTDLRLDTFSWQKNICTAAVWYVVVSSSQSSLWSLRSLNDHGGRGMERGVLIRVRNQGSHTGSWENKQYNQRPTVQCTPSHLHLTFILTNGLMAQRMVHCILCVGVGAILLRGYTGILCEPHSLIMSQQAVNLHPFKWGVQIRY